MFMSASLLLGANFLRNLSVLTVLILISSFEGHEKLGQYTLALAVATPVFTFLQLGLKNIYLTTQSVVNFTKLLQIHLFSMSAGLVLCALLAWFFWPNLFLICVLVAVAKASDFTFELFSAPNQRFGKIRSIFFSNLFLALFVIPSSWFILFSKISLEVLVAFLAVSSWFVTLFLLFPSTSKTLENNAKTQFDISVKALLTIGISLGFSVSLLALVVSFPQYIIGFFDSAASAGKLAAVLYGIALADIFMAVVAQAWIPKAQIVLEERHNAGDFPWYVHGQSLRYALVGIPVGIVGSYLMYLTYPFLFQINLNIFELLPIFLSVVLIPAQHFSSTALQLKNQYIRSTMPSIIAVLFSIIFSLLLIPAFSVLGGLWAILIAIAARALSGTLLLHNSKQIDNPGRQSAHENK